MISVIQACSTVTLLRLNLYGRRFQPIDGNRDIAPKLEECFKQRLP